MYFEKTLTDCRDSRELYNELKRYGLNVTDMGSEVFVYGDIDESDYEKILRICISYGSIEN